MAVSIIWFLCFVPIRVEHRHGCVVQNNIYHLPTFVTGQRLSAFLKSKSAVTFACQLVGRSVTNKGNLLKFHGDSFLLLT
jgi:hypothetical protein